LITIGAASQNVGYADQPSHASNFISEMHESGFGFDAQLSGNLSYNSAALPIA
jgi:hypothetical protein